MGLTPSPSGNGAGGGEGTARRGSAGRDLCSCQKPTLRQHPRLGSGWESAWSLRLLSAHSLETDGEEGAADPGRLEREMPGDLVGGEGRGRKGFPEEAALGPGPVRRQRWQDGAPGAAGRGPRCRHTQAPLSHTDLLAAWGLPQARRRSQPTRHLPGPLGGCALWPWGVLTSPLSCPGQFLFDRVEGISKATIVDLDAHQVSAWRGWGPPSPGGL